MVEQVYVWLNALQNSGSRCDRDVGAKIVKEHLPKSEVERCHTFVRAIKLVLQGLDESWHQNRCGRTSAQHPMLVNLQR